jgi:hypothetical protein
VQVRRKTAACPAFSLIERASVWAALPLTPFFLLGKHHNGLSPTPPPGIMTMFAHNTFFEDSVS